MAYISDNPQAFDRMIKETSNPDTIAKLEIAREYFTNPEFRQKLENYSFEATFHSEPSKKGE
jgi:hypothetical protein